MVSQTELNFDLWDLPFGWEVIETLSDIDSELGGRQYAPSPAVREVVKLIQQQTPDDRQAVAVLSDALPGVDGRPHQLVERFAEALRSWRERCQRRKDDGLGAHGGDDGPVPADASAQPTGPGKLQEYEAGEDAYLDRLFDDGGQLPPVDLSGGDDSGPVGPPQGGPHATT